MRGSTIIFDTENSFYVYNAFVCTGTEGQQKSFKKAIPFIRKNGEWIRCDINYTVNLRDFNTDILGDSDQDILFTNDRIVGHKMNLYDNNPGQLIDKNGNIIYSLSQKKGGN